MSVAAEFFHTIFFFDSTHDQKGITEGKMNKFWNHTIRRYIQTTAARRSAAEHGSSEGKFDNSNINAIDLLSALNVRK